MEGIEAATAAGLKVKINCVALKGVNDDEIHDLVRWCGDSGHDLTFIEVMPMGDVGGDAAATFTLPAATGSGAEFQFIVSVVNTSNYVIKVADATDTIDGSVTLHQDSATTVSTFNTAADSDTITLNGTTQGGVSIGDEITLIDIASNQYMVKGILTASGTEATPFSASVS